MAHLVSFARALERKKEGRACANEAFRCRVSGCGVAAWRLLEVGEHVAGQPAGGATAQTVCDEWRHLSGQEFMAYTEAKK